MMDRREVLPLPLGPISARTSPGLQHPVMLNSICMPQCKTKISHVMQDGNNTDITRLMQRPTTGALDPMQW
jgi:hypothetical protein